MSDIYDKTAAEIIDRVTMHEHRTPTWAGIKRVLAMAMEHAVHLAVTEIREGARAGEVVEVMAGRPVAGEWQMGGAWDASREIPGRARNAAFAMAVWHYHDSTEHRWNVWRGRETDESQAAVLAKGFAADLQSAMAAADAWARANPHLLDWQMPPASEPAPASTGTARDLDEHDAMICRQAELSRVAFLCRQVALAAGQTRMAGALYALGRALVAPPPPPMGEGEGVRRLGRVSGWRRSAIPDVITIDCDGPLPADPSGRVEVRWVDAAPSDSLCGKPGCTDTRPHGHLSFDHAPAPAVEPSREVAEVIAWLRERAADAGGHGRHEECARFERMAAAVERLAREVARLAELLDEQSRRRFAGATPLVYTQADVDGMTAALRAQLSEAVATLRAYVERESVTHDEDCPEDDTCNCSAAPLIKRINAACALIPPPPAGGEA